MPTRRTFVASAAMAIALFAAAPAHAAIEDVQTPVLSGPEPVSATSHPFLATDIDLAKYGYVEEEFELAGNAYRYNTPALATGSRIESGGPANDGLFPYRTRMVVRRPANPADFNGVVVAEWYNVTAQYDLEANWFGDPHHLLENGYAFVGISAQRVGVNHLRGWDPERYGDLDVTAGDTVTPNDALSYEIFSAAVKAIKGEGGGADPLGGLEADTVIASGESQSGGRLSTYYNSIQPLHEVVDAFLITVSNGELRDDRPEKAIRVISETENRNQRTEPDNASYRHWEVAGGSHVPRMAYDNWQGPVTRDTGGQDVECEKFPLSNVQWPYVVNTAIDDLVSWSDGGAAPPIAPRGEYVDPSTLARNSLGIAEGGIRLPEVTVPTALNTGTNAAAPDGPPLSVFCILLGSYEIFPSEVNHATYGDHGAYIDQVVPAAQVVVDQGFLLPSDLPRLIAQHERFPELRPTPPALINGAARNRSGKFTLGWRGTEAPGATFELQQSKDGGRTWKAAKGASSIAGESFAFGGKGQRDGNWSYRVRSSSPIPANVVRDAYTVTTPWSEASAQVLTDGTGPKIKLRCPRKAKVGQRVFAKAKAKDALSRVEHQPPRKVRVKTNRPGVRKIKVKAADSLGNKSRATCKVKVRP